MNFNKEKYLQYLPSKKFAIITGVILILAIIIFVIFFMSSSPKSFSIGEKKNNLALKIENRTVTDLIQNDTDRDGIADWEESLWGTDKNKKVTFDDTPDATYIENKKKDLKTEQGTEVDETKLTETEKFAREFFTSYTAMKSSGEIDDETINSFGSALGQKIVNPTLIDRYKNTDVKINSTDNTATKQKYYEGVESLFKNYQKEGLGSELDIVNKGLGSSSAESQVSSSQYAKLLIIASAYQNFAKKVMELGVPKSLSEYHLRIANSANNTGISVLNMEKLTSDPIIGLSGLSQYQKYSEDLVKAVVDLETTLVSLSQ